MHPNRSDTALGHLTDSELAGFLDQDLSPDERRHVEEHLGACDACRGEAVGAARLLAEDWDRQAGAADGNGGRHSGSITSPHADRVGRRRWRFPAAIVGLTAAAALAGVLFVEPGALPRGPHAQGQERFVTEGVDRLPVHAPSEDGEVARGDLRCAWADRGTESYRITVAAEDGRLVWSQALADTTAVPPPTLALDAGQRFFWYVDAISAGVVARTGAHSFRIAP